MCKPDRVKRRGRKPLLKRGSILKPLSFYMNLYYVNINPQANGDHEVHAKHCYFIPNDKKFLGFFSNCSDAIKEAKKTYSQSNGCKTCNNECHTS